MIRSTALPATELLARSLVPKESAGLFVGVRELRDATLSKVEFAVDDAVDLAHVFSIELGLIAPENVVLALAGEPRKASSREYLQALAAAGAEVVGATLHDLYFWAKAAGGKTGSAGLYVVSFAGHGFTDQGTNIFCASDTLYSRMVHTGLNLDAVGDDINEASAPRRLILVDACRTRLTQNRNFGEDGRAATGEFLAAFSKVRGQAAIYSASRGGYSYDDHKKQNGAFSAAVVEGLRGRALSRQVYLTVGSLASYVHQALCQWIRINRPEHRDVSMGISKTYDPPDIEELPLAYDPQFQQLAAEFGKRRKEALERLRANLADPITGDIFDWISRTLQGYTPSDLAQELLGEIEQLDGTPRPRRALVQLVSEHRRDSGGSPLPAPPEETPAPEGLSPQLRNPRAGTAKAPATAKVEPRTASASLPWAADSGKDRFGEWADLRIGEAVQRLRWIPPGSFLIGSEPTETGRYATEGPRTQVEFRTGFWLGDTPCSQQLWQTVMNRNPSRFRSPDRPVEQVSWHDIETFLVRLNDRIPGLNPELPSEAQWEYACRAGSATGTYAGDLEILGVNNSPTLEEIAWYAGNSGREFELTDGEETQQWPERAHLDPYAGSRRLKLKRPNAWGLYDILGNVWEWCSDSWQESYTWNSAHAEGPIKVIRGGSWASNARNVRAACRTWRRAIKGDFDLGFRLALECLVP